MLSITVKKLIKKSAIDQEVDDIWRRCYVAESILEETSTSILNTSYFETDLNYQATTFILTGDLKNLLLVQLTVYQRPIWPETKHIY